MMIAAVLMTTGLLMVIGYWVLLLVKGKPKDNLLDDLVQIIEPDKWSVGFYLSAQVVDARQIVFQHVNWAYDKERLSKRFSIGYQPTVIEFNEVLFILKKQCALLKQEKGWDE